MKKISFTVAILALCISILSCESVFSAVLANNARPKVYPVVNLLAAPSVLHSPLRLVFPYESFNHAVCRKPAFLFLTDQRLSDFYFSRVSFNTQPLGNNYLKINQNITFKRGNSYLLIPKGVTLPLNENFGRFPKPTLNLHKPD